jgi:hypothetical protein
VSAVRFVLVPVSLIEQVERKEISRDAAWLNVVLLSHVNRKRGDSEVWHTRETLAPEMGVSKASNIDKYIKGLESVGNIKVERRVVGAHKTRNRYTVLNVVPSPIVPTLGPSIVPELGSSIVPESGPELYEEKPHESELDESSHRPDASASGEIPRADARGSVNPKNQHGTVPEILLANVYDDTAASIVVKYLRQHLNVDSPALYLQKIADDGGPSGVQAIVDKATAWKEDLDDHYVGDHEWFTSSCHFDQDVATSLSDLYRDALEIRCTETDLDDAINAVFRSLERGSVGAYRAAMQRLIDQRIAKRAEERESWRRNRRAA